MSIIDSLKEIYDNRGILHSMVVRNLKGRYKNSYLGFAWHFITPTVMIVLFYIVYTGIMQKSIENYWVYLCVGMFPFTFFQTNLGSGSGCIIAEGGTIKKMYFPREIIVLSQVTSTFITLIISYSVVIVLMLVSGCSFNGYALLFLPLILLLSVIFATGYVLMFSAITVFIRDIQYIIQAISRVFFWLTPIFYMVGDLTGILNSLIWYNPFTYFIEVYHDILYQMQIPNLLYLGICCTISFFALILGYKIFDKFKGKFAEEL